MRPSLLWKDLSAERRLPLADAFWRDTEATDVRLQHAEAAAAIARRLNFRLKSVQTLPIERRAHHLAHMNDVSEMVAMRAFIAYHLAAQRPLMAAFLDALGMSHDRGIITADDVARPDPTALAKAIDAVRQAFPAADVDLYLRTLVAIDGETWGQIEPLLTAHPSPS